MRYSGIALHTGGRAHITFKPGEADQGVVIARVDLPGKPEVPAHATSVVGVKRATTIARGEAKVHTVEHVLATLYALGIDNVRVEMDGPEPPIADGSALPYLELLQGAGTVAQAAPRRYCRIREPLFFEADQTRMVFLPCDEYRISCTVSYGACLMDTQYLSLAIDAESFAKELGGARTFCLYEEIEPLMKAGLIRGGSLDNSNVIKDGAIVCKEALRYPDELVRHKMLDIVGDLSLIGRRLIGQVIAIKPGHPSNVALAREVVARLAQWDEVPE